MMELVLDYGPLVVLAVWVVTVTLVTFGLCRAAAEGDRQLRAQRAELRAERQERAAQRAAHPRTGQVEAAPRLVPLADVIDFPQDAA